MTEMNVDVVRNALNDHESNLTVILDEVTVLALKELLEYRQTGLTPDEIKEIKSDLDYYKDEYCDIQARYDELLHEMEE